MSPPAQRHSNDVIVARGLVLTGFRRASDCVGVQSDQRLCFKHTGEFVCHCSQGQPDI